MPKRIQLSRKKGWRMPPNTVSVARPGKWGNPYVIQFDPHPDYSPQNAPDAVKMFRNLLQNSALMLRDIEELRGKNLACWCKAGQPCHADVLIEFANRPKAK